MWKINKLKNKVFFVIFGILTIFLISILLIFNIQDYKREKNNIKSNLMRIDPDRNRLDNKIQNNVIDKADIPSDKIFMDYAVYVVSINNEGEIIAIANHSQNKSITEEGIEEEALQIIKNRDLKKNNIGNLYFEKYSYSIKNDRIVIIDNTRAKDRIIETLKISLLIFISIELIIIYVGIKLTNWIIKPVKETFDKQKQFIADASHELKTPLAVIIASSEALEKEPKETKWLNNIKNETERMNYLISDLLDMARSENVEIQYQKENISKTIEKAILTFESLMFEKNIKLEYKIEPNIELFCNNLQIKQLLGILMDNAIKHSVPKGEIQITLNKEKNDIILKVRNKGKEIPKEEQEKIFERFYRVDESRNRSENRYGIGLAIAKNIVENYNGTIQVNCENGYTTFIANLK